VYHDFYQFRLSTTDYAFSYEVHDRFCGLVVRVPDYRSRGPGFDYRSYQIFWEVVGLERGPFRLVSTIEELLARNSSKFGLENREYGPGDPLRWPRSTLYPQKLALTSPTSGFRSVSIVRLRTKATELVCMKFMPKWPFGNGRSFISTRLKHLTFCASGFTLFIGPTVLLSAFFCYTLNDTNPLG
jgi:hypothetical protein